MMEATGFGRMELLRVAETVAQEKGISADEVIEAMEQAVQTAARRKYGLEHEIVAELDRQTGDLRVYRQLEVAEPVEEVATQIALEDARRQNPAAELGDHILEPLPPIDLGRIAAQSAKQVIVQKVREAERERQYEEFKDRIGEIIVGEVKRTEHGNVLVDLGRAEAIVRREDLIQREMFHNKDRIRAYIYDVRHELRGPQIFLSRTHPAFMAKLFEQEVPEIYDGIIEIKSVARDPGSRAKIAVISKDSSIDPVGACVGMRGSRVQAVVGELGGEKIDIIPWSPDDATFVVNALAPAEVTKVVLDPETNRIEVVVPDDQQHIAIGRRGQNVRLAAPLTGWDIDIISETEESGRRHQEFRQLTEMFTDRLNVEEMIAQLLATEGYTSVEEVADSPIEELATIQGFDEEIGAAIKERAQQTLEDEFETLRQSCIDLQIGEDLAQFESLELPQIVRLGEQGVKTLDDLADLAGDELIELLPEAGLTADRAGEIIMEARAHWFADEPTLEEVADGKADEETIAAAAEPTLEGGADDEAHEETVAVATETVGDEEERAPS
ncbi:MAG: transcription termination factor NusA [Geminicoccaceae bacterium]